MPKIVSSLNILRHSGRMCPEAWETLLTGLDKTKADDEPLDFLQGMSICGPLDTLWQMPTHPEHGEQYRSLAVVIARSVVHLADHRAARRVLDCLEQHLAGRIAFEQVLISAPPYLRALATYEHHSWELAEVGEAATGAAMMTLYHEPCLSPFLVARAAERAFQDHKLAEKRLSMIIRDFLSSDEAS